MGRSFFKRLSNLLQSRTLRSVGYIAHWRHLGRMIPGELLGILIPAHIPHRLVLHKEDAWQALNHRIRKCLLAQEPPLCHLATAALQQQTEDEKCLEKQQEYQSEDVRSIAVPDRGFFEQHNAGRRQAPLTDSPAA